MHVHTAAKGGMEVVVVAPCFLDLNLIYALPWDVQACLFMMRGTSTLLAFLDY